MAAYFTPPRRPSNPTTPRTLLSNEAVHDAAHPDRIVPAFLQTTHEAAAQRAAWDRASLEDDPARWNHVR